MKKLLLGDVIVAAYDSFPPAIAPLVIQYLLKRGFLHIARPKLRRRAH